MFHWLPLARNYLIDYRKTNDISFKSKDVVSKEIGFNDPLIWSKGRLIPEKGLCLKLGSQHTGFPIPVYVA
jgi:hypothetical protein